MDSSSGFLYLLLVILLILSAFFSASETAFSSLNKIRMHNYAENGDKKAQRALRLSERFDALISTILVGNNVVNMASASIATVLATDLLGASGAAIATAVMTVLVLIFGEIIPKTIAKEHSEKTAMSTSVLLVVIIRVMTPVVWVFLRIKDFSMRMLQVESNQPSVTEQELKYIVESIEQEGVLEEQESELVQSALEFDEITVQEILTPRVDLLAISAESSLAQALEIALDAHYSRLPVYRGTLDNIIGVLQVRDLLKAVVLQKKQSLTHLLTDCVYIHKTMRISALLNELQAKKLHLAVVSDDYGGTMGIVTMEDVLEQLVGDIWDESDEVVHDLEQTGDNSFHVSGDMNVFELLEELGVDDRDFDSDYNTVGGWAMEMLGHIPNPGEQFTYKTLTITIKVVERKRLVSLQVDRTSEPEDGTDHTRGSSPRKE